MSAVRPTVLANPIALSKASRYIPLWRRQMEYPVYQPGDPQVRLYMPNYWMKLVRPRFPLPPGVLKFEVQPQMTAHEVRQMLEKLYGVKLLHAQVHHLEGSPERDLAHPSQMIKLSPYNSKPPPFELYRKVAYVFLAEGQQFQFPDLFATRRPSGSEKMKEMLRRQAAEEEKLRIDQDAHRDARSMRLLVVEEVERRLKVKMEDTEEEEQR